MILGLLQCLTSWSQNNNLIVPLRGNLNDKVLISIESIKKANIKLIERKHFINIINQQDSIINLKNLYINNQNKIINNFQNRIYNINELNKSINKDIAKYKRRNKIVLYGAVGIITGCIIGVLIK